MKKRSIGVIDINSPVILGFAFLSLVLLGVNWLTGGFLNNLLAIRYTSWLDPMMYVRLFTHTLMHANFGHYLNNMLLFLVVGPIAEEKYGGKNLLVMFAITSAITGLINVVFFRNVMLIGASGLVFMLILLASFTNQRDGKIPLTVIVVALLYIGNEIVNGIFVNDNISQISHIIGGICGAVFGFLFAKQKGVKTAL